MRKILLLAFTLLVAGCHPEEEKDWILGKWAVVSCTYVNELTGGSGDCQPGFKTWEFLSRGKVIVDDDRSVPYWHKNGKVNVDGITYEEVVYGRDMMQLQQVGVAGVTTYTFRKEM